MRRLLKWQTDPDEGLSTSRLARVVAIAVSIGLIGAACGGGDSDKDSTQAAAPLEQGAADESAAAPETAAPEASTPEVAAPADAATPATPAASSPSAPAATTPAKATSGAAPVAGSSKPAAGGKAAAPGNAASGSPASPGAGAAPAAAAPGQPAGAAPAPAPVDDGKNPGATDVGVSASAIKLGTINGINAPLGNIAAIPVYTMLVAGLRAANDAGGIYGRKIQVIDCDDAGKSDLFHACYQKHVNQEKIFALTTSFSWGSGWVGGNLERDKMPWIGSWGYFSKEWKNPWMFPVHMASVHEAHAMAQWVIDRIKPKTVGILYLNAAEQKLALAACEEAFKKAGIEIVRKIEQEIETGDESANVLSMRAANPDFIVHFSWFPPVIKFMVDAAQQNYWPPQGMAGNHFLGQVIGELVGSWPLQSMWTISTYELWGTEYLAAGEKYAPQMKARHHHITQSGFIGGQILVDAAKETGPNLTREGIMKVLESKEWDFGPGMGQSVMWGPGNHDTMRCGHMFKYNTADSNSYKVYVPDDGQYEVCDKLD
jgi:ABC-type branched-subunit amino acid transport system substrate-binding protein